MSQTAAGKTTSPVSRQRASAEGSASPGPRADRKAVASVSPVSPPAMSMVAAAPVP